MIVIGLGGATRAMNAGLACPDWPLCFGKIIPDYHPQVYFEFIHRSLAGLMGLFAFVMLAIAFRSGKISKNLKLVIFCAVIIYLAQVIMGGLTVLKLLQPGAVATHLVLGISFMAILQWVYLSLPRIEFTDSKSSQKAPTWIFMGAVLILFTTALQIILGGKVASHYAGLVCGSDFPLCNGQLVPTMSGPIGIHVMHRFGAYFTFLAAVTFFTSLILKKVQQTHVRLVKSSRVLISLILAQMALGIANIKFLLPALITVLHTILAAGIIATVVYIIYLAKNGERYSASA